MGKIFDSFVELCKTPMVFMYFEVDGNQGSPIKRIAPDSGIKQIKNKMMEQIENQTRLIENGT